VKYHNVLPFDPVGRGGMARRGAPDKNGAFAAAEVVLACPTCACELRLEADWLDGLADVLCGRCETEIPLVPLEESG
jgi:hypothetical protein